MNLKEYLFYKKMSISDFSKEIGCSRPYISTVVNGRKVCSKKLKEKIIKYLEKNPVQRKSDGHERNFFS